jgi:ACS family hexuronate transporter-like MFS transporter
MLLTGLFLDKFGTRFGYLWAVIVWSIAQMAHSAARGVTSFAIARAALGIGGGWISSQFIKSGKGI